MSEKRCGCCKEFKAPTEFWRRTEASDGLQSWCKDCTKQYRRDISAMKQRQQTISREYYYTNQADILTRQGEYYQLNRDAIRAREAELRPIREARKAYRLMIAQLWRDDNRDLIAVAIERRRAREAGLPDTWTIEQWRATVAHFNGCCAVCGQKPDGVNRFLAADHWIALNDPRPDNPGTVAWNIVPLCHGVGGCNNSKSDRDALDWLTGKFGQTKGYEVYSQITTYLKTLNTVQNRQPLPLWRKALDWFLSWSFSTERAGI